ncbi:hypothetical protein PVAP13_6NG091209 [Panicum virgatum]|uniref:Uncharacterized protein n=1 Tax=Panicum virgatum TaxID=38727 RepID=A0A8T0QWE8_PANVG|nr:hypothetical protein PVAP13_6NG091209 [Panicum virgatum]
MADDASSKEEQARRAQALAEKCFLAGNVHGARQWMQSAARLGPGLPGAARVAAAYDVHAAAAPPPVLVRSAGPAAARHPRRRQAAAPKALPPRAPRQEPLRRRRRCLQARPGRLGSALRQAHARRGGGQPTRTTAHTSAATAPPSWPPPQYRQQASPPRPGPQVVKRHQRAPATVSRAGAPTMSSYAYAHQASRQHRPPEKGSPQPPTGRRPTSPARDKCPACGAWTINGKMSFGAFRCGICHWSPMDDRPPDDDDDFFEDDYY